MRLIDPVVAVKGPGGYTCRLVPSIDRVDPDVWDEVCTAGDAGIAMDRRFIAAAEHSFAAQCRFFHAIICDGAGAAAACATFSTHRMDLAPLAGGRVQQIGSSVRRLVPTFLQSKVLFCGLPLFFGLPPLAFGRGSATGPVTAVLAWLARRIAQDEGADFVVFKEFAPAAATQVGTLVEHGFVRVETPPMYHFAPHGRTFEDYLAALRWPYRRQLVRGLRKFEAAGFHHVRVSEPDKVAKLYTTDVHRLYEQIAATAELNVGCLPFAFVPELARRLPGQVSLGVAYKGEAAAGFGCTLRHGHRCHVITCGFDRVKSREGDVYFNVMYRDLAHAMNLGGVDDIEMGQTADVFKSRLGCDPTPLQLFARPVRPLSALILKVGFEKFLKPGIYPTPRRRHIFRETGAASGP